MKTKNITAFMLGCLLVALMPGCQKNEFMPPPEGEPVPVEAGVTKNLVTLLAESPYELFHTAWERSHMGHWLDSLGSPKAQFTLLVPSDAAFEAAGYTAARISEMTVDQLDKLLSFYIVRNAVTKDELTGRSSGYAGISLRNEPGLQARYFIGDGTTQTRFDPYYYRHYLALADGKLLVNGERSGSADAGIPAADGYIWPLDHCIPLPDQTFLEALESDPRFSMFLELQRKTDSVTDWRYRQAYKEYTGGFDPGEGYSGKDFRVGLVVGQSTFADNVMFNTLFAPTNDAFVAAGFHTVDEMLEWNERTPPFVFDENNYKVVGGFPSDTLVSFLRDWGRITIPYSPSWGYDPSAMPTVFYQNDLNNELLANYLIYYEGDALQYRMPLDFSPGDAGQIRVQVRGSSYPPATVVGTVNTLMGPIHAIDHLFFPKDFKLN